MQFPDAECFESVKTNLSTCDLMLFNVEMFTGDCPDAECSESVSRERANKVFQIRLLDHRAGLLFLKKHPQNKTENLDFNVLVFLSKFMITTTFALS